MATHLVFDHISFCYPGASRAALQDCQLDFPVGAMGAVLGPNGAGKTTLLRLLGGKLRANAGTIIFPSAWCGASGGLDPLLYGLLIENPGIYRRLSVREYLLFFGGFYRITNLPERIDEDCARLGLTSLDQRLDQLSLGNRQKVQLVRTLLHRPRLALLDEPVANLDPLSREAVWQWLRHLNQTDGITAIVCSHVLGEIADICSHVALIRQGRVLVSGSLAEVMRSRSAPVRVTITLGNGEQICYTTPVPERDNPEKIRSLVTQGADVLEVRMERPTLADVYRQWMGEGDCA